MDLLPTETRSKLRSTQILTSMTQVVSELFQNALDAGASHVDVGVDVEEWSCWVRDNGCGMSKQDMSILATASNVEERRYGTSKAHSLASLDVVDSFGFRGEALASVADLACLEIASRTGQSGETWSLILKHDKTLYFGPAVRWKRESQGTVVCVRDAFFNLPVRRLSHSSPARAIELVRQELESIALMFPHVSFTLKNENEKKDTFTLKVPKTGSTIAAFRHIYGRELIEHVEEMSSTRGDLKLDGFISLVGAVSRSHQFIYVNKRWISPCDLHQIVENKFNQSTFTKHALDENDNYFGSQPNARRAPRKATQRPIYVFNLTIPQRQVDNCVEPTKTALHLSNKEAVISLLTDTVTSFLVRHGYLSKPKPKEVEALPPPSKKRRLQEGRSFDPSLMARLGLVDRDPAENSSLEQNEESLDYSRSLYRRSLPRNPPETGTRPAWIEDALNANEAYPPTDSPIPIVKTGISDGLHKIDRVDLKQVQVVGQVDGKFIACVSPNGTLILVDQHAADERIRVERFLKELDDGAIVEIDPPKPVLLTSHELRKLALDDTRAAFLRWGIRFLDVQPVETLQGGYQQVLVDQVPAVVYEKIMMNDELRDVIRGFLAKLDSGISVNTLRGCPDELLELVKSKACRGAIMFNDLLSLEQCQRLVKQLAETQFPFQCAHGRPSLIPLTNFGEEAC